MEDAFDDDVSTSFVSSKIDCALEWHLPAASAADVYAIKIHPVPPSQHGNGHVYLRGGVIEGTTGEEGAPWVTLVDIPRTLPHGWSTHLVAAQTQSTSPSLYRKIRLKATSNGARCRVAEMRIVGAVRRSVANNGVPVGGDSPSCAVEVEVVKQGVNNGDAVVYATSVVVDGNNNNHHNNFTYARSATPVVSSINPAEGTTGGGTSVTLTGGGLSASASVVIDGVACAVNAGLSGRRVVY